MLEEHGLDEPLDHLALVGIEVARRLIGQPEVLVGIAIMLSEDERVSRHVHRDGDLGEHVEGGRTRPRFIAADLGDVDADAVGEGLLGQAPFFAGGGEAGGEVHEHVDCGYVDHTAALRQCLT